VAPAARFARVLGVTRCCAADLVTGLLGWVGVVLNRFSFCRRSCQIAASVLERRRSRVASLLYFSVYCVVGGLRQNAPSSQTAGAGADATALLRVTADWQKRPTGVKATNTATNRMTRMAARRPVSLGELVGKQIEEPGPACLVPGGQLEHLRKEGTVPSTNMSAGHVQWLEEVAPGKGVMAPLGHATQEPPCM
jgi:hypothetical protein